MASSPTRYIDGVSRSFFPVRPNGHKGYPARVELRPARPARLPDARHRSHWLDLPVPRVSLAPTVRLLLRAARWWRTLALPGRRVSFWLVLPTSHHSVKERERIFAILCAAPAMPT